MDTYPAYGVRAISTARGLPLLPDLAAITARPIEEAVRQVDATAGRSEVDKFYHDVRQTSGLSRTRTLATGVVRIT